ncbi:MAG: alpha/beta hydrolase [Pseudomonadales bacterium]|nr:alpha/beta hydrolase [Pseudomonadales bacterium]
MSSAEIRSGIASTGQTEIYYEDWGDLSHPPILLIMGLSAQMIYWPDSLMQTLVDAGYRAIRFDNRDIGLSGKLNSRQRYNMTTSMIRSSLGLSIQAPYTLDDMADDTLGLMNHLQLQHVHLIGISMGGMISQILAARLPERIKSLCLLMTSPLSPGLFPPSPSMLWTMLSGGFGGRKRQGLGRPQPEDIAEFLTRLQGQRYRTDKNQLIAMARRSLDRSYHPAGVVRQTLAVLATADLSKRIRKIQCPSLIVHGRDDPLVPWWAGWRISRLIPGARFKLVPGLGHDLPASFLPELSSWVIDQCRQADARA